MAAQGTWQRIRCLFISTASLQSIVSPRPVARQVAWSARLGKCLEGCAGSVVQDQGAGAAARARLSLSRLQHVGRTKHADRNAILYQPVPGVGQGVWALGLGGSGACCELAAARSRMSASQHPACPHGAFLCLLTPICTHLLYKHGMGQRDRGQPVRAPATASARATVTCRPCSLQPKPYSVLPQSYAMQSRASERQER